ncbi:MAG: hypothetical protein AB1626_00610 [Candidatus Micrarchaeota archaeon]
MTEEHQQHHEHRAHEQASHEHQAQHAAPEHAHHSAPSPKQQEWLAYVIAALVGGLVIGFGVHALLTPAPQAQLPAQSFATPIPAQAGIGAQAAGSKAVAYLNENLLAAQGVSATLKNATEKNGMYLIAFEVKQGTQTQQAQAYVSLDGKLMVIPYGNALNLDEKLELASPQQQEVPKTDSPDVKLFVMSFCPYGEQAENAMSPVARLLGDSADIEPHFVVYGDYCTGGRCNESEYCLANGTYCSMHGLNELREDVRQLCVWKYAKESWWDYVDAVNSDCTLSNIETCWTTAAEQAGLNATQISACLDNEAEELLAPEAALNELHQVQGSPTLLINGVSFAGGRSPEAFKAGICDAFNTPPAACSQNVSSSAAASAPAAGGCGT